MLLKLSAVRSEASAGFHLTCPRASREATLVLEEPPQPPIDEALEEILPLLPEVFDKNDVIRLLGWNPPRATLFRALQNLTRAGRLALKSYGGGRTSNVYRQIGSAEEAPPLP